jgi:hypothetical protein
LQGSFEGLAFRDAQIITLSVGQFSSSISTKDFVQDPDTNILTYQDSTGLAPGWISGLTIDPSSGTFSAQGAGIVLAGLPNPFAVKLGTENGSACTMVRVQTGDGTSFELASIDGVLQPCSIPSSPQVSPAAFFAGQPADVRFRLTVLPTANLDTESVQLFRSDINAQPVGFPLCTLRDSGNVSDGDVIAGDGTYGCIVHFAEATPGKIPLVAQARAGTSLLLSSGFSVLVVAPMSQADIDAITAVEGAVGAAWDDKVTRFGATAQARMQTIAAIRGLPGVAEVRLLEDGLSIGIQFTSGVRYALVLNRLLDGQGVAGATGAQSHGPVIAEVGTSLENRNAGLLDSKAASAPVACNSPTRPVVRNNSTLIWDAGFFPEPNVPSIAAQAFGAVKCPGFFVKHVDATIENAQLFPDYGTIIIETHGFPWFGDIVFLTKEEIQKPPPGDPLWTTLQNGGITAASPDHVHWYKSLTNRFFESLGPFQKTIVFVSACYGANSSAMADVFAAKGGAYYGFTDITFASFQLAGVTIPGFPEMVAPKLFNYLLGDYQTVSDAYQGVDHSDPTLQALLSLPFAGWAELLKALTGVGVSVNQLNSRFVLLNDSSNKLAYLGNPVIASLSGMPPSFTTGPTGVLNLKAQLEGAVGCDGTMNYMWNNPAKQGHLTPASGGGRDVFTSLDPLAIYSANSATTPGGDENLMVDFFPDGSTAVPARACATVHVPAGCIAVIGNGQGVPCSFAGSIAGAGNWTLQLITTGPGPYGTFMITFATPPKQPGGYGIMSKEIVSASGSISPNGQGTQPTYTMKFPRDPSGPPDQDGFTIRLNDVTDLSTPHGDVSTGGRSADGSHISLNFVF